MPTALESLRAGLENGTVDRSLLAEVEKEFRELTARVDELEKCLIMIVRTGWPWDEEGEPNTIYHASRDGFAAAMAEARELLGLGGRSRITRTEPKT